MSEVFYRKWRPIRLDQVVGQEPVVKTLKQAVSSGRIAHAYLFCGPRGTGKTSTARILAKAVNCLSPNEGEPDNQCDVCHSINEGSALDLIEIDAASNRGIDDIRNLSDKIRFTPNEARYKVYIIDEVHMLTEHAFNALLKTLEEPPSHAIFILATTESHKVPLTIISRCQRFDFRRITMTSATDKLKWLCKEEGIEIEQAALNLVARSSRGSLRDAENLLEQIVISYGSNLTEQHVRDLLELGGDESALDLIVHIINRESREGLTLINQVTVQGGDLRQLQRGTVEYLRALLLIKTNAASSLGYPNETITKLKSLVDNISIEYIVFALKSFSKANLHKDGGLPLPLELALVDSTTQEFAVPKHEKRSPTATASSYTPANITETSKPNPIQSHPPKQETSSNTNQKDMTNHTPAQTTSLQTPNSESSNKLDTDWNEIVSNLRHTGKRFKLGALLRGCREREISDGFIILKFPYSSHVDRMQQELSDPETNREFEEILLRVMNAPYKIKVSLLSTQQGNSNQGTANKSYLVRSARAMGAQVVDEKEKGNHDEQENAPTSSANATKDVETSERS